MQAVVPFPAQATSLVTEGIAAINRQEKDRARALLLEAVQLDPRNEQAWLWLSGVVDSDVERQRCLARVLEINPDHQSAQLGLKMLGTPLAPAAVPAAPVAVAPTLIRLTTAVAPSDPIVSASDAVFLRDRFMLRQKIALNEKYHVWDEHNQPILFVERPRHLLRGLLSVLAAFAMGSILFFLGVAVATQLPPGLVSGIFFVLYLLASIAITFTTLITLAVKRHTTFYRDETKREPLLSVLQDSKLYLINATYTVRDASDQIIGTFRKNLLYDLIRKRWYCYAPNGALLCVAKEDSMLRSFLRRAFRQVGGAIGAIVQPLLRTNFVILHGATPIGMFNRKLTLLDRYVLDMSADTAHVLDRRLALALGVLLDTGERR